MREGEVWFARYCNPWYTCHVERSGRAIESCSFFVVAQLAWLDYMSIEELLDELCAAGKLVKWEPRYDGDEARYRRIYVAPAVRDWLHPRGPLPHKELQRSTDVRRFLKSFVVGELFDDEEKLKNLDTEAPRKSPCQGRWAIRIKREPQARIFGGFPEANIFVGSHVIERASIADWQAEKAAFDAFWKTLVHEDVTEGGTIRHSLPLLMGHTRTVLVSNVRVIRR